MEEMLLHTTNTEEAIAEIESLGGRVTLLLGDDLIVAKVSRELIAKKTTFASSSAHISSSASPETLMFAYAFYKAREDMKNLNQLLNAGLIRHLQWPLLENPLFPVEQIPLISKQ